MNSASDIQIVDDKLKYMQFIEKLRQMKNPSSPLSNIVVLKAFAEKIRSYHGFTCWIAIRVITCDQNGDDSYLLDALALRSYLLGDPDPNTSLSQCLLTTPKTHKLFLCP